MFWLLSSFDEHHCSTLSLGLTAVAQNWGRRGRAEQVRGSGSSHSWWGHRGQVGQGR